MAPDPVGRRGAPGRRTSAAARGLRRRAAGWRQAARRLTPLDSGSDDHPTARMDRAMNDDAMQARFDRQHAASRTQPAPDAAARRDALARLRRLIVANVDAIAAAISDDFGRRSKTESELLEIGPTLNAIRHASKSLAGWMKPQRRGIDITFQPGRAWVRHEPLGVVGIMAPWNYPLILTLAPLADALAAGNRAMLKPSELTPHFSELLQRLVAEHFAADQVTVVVGDVPVARAFSALPFDHLLFTGSTHVGREVMRAAAENLTPVTLELGGKSP
ncbi:MAG: aldehyde dehydrogenase family protein, partial [Aurantimonas coralicida]